MTDILDHTYESDLTQEESEKLLLVSEHAITTPLSPAAQAVWSAFLNHSEWEVTTSEIQGIAAALRAAADLIVPYEKTPQGMSKSVMEYSNREYRRAQRQETRAELLAIAAELEAQ